jgi:hypothetical protein
MYRFSLLHHTLAILVPFINPRLNANFDNRADDWGRTGWLALYLSCHFPCKCEKLYVVKIFENIPI